MNAMPLSCILAKHEEVCCACNARQLHGGFPLPTQNDIIQAVKHLADMNTLLTLEQAPIR